MTGLSHVSLVVPDLADVDADAVAALPSSAITHMTVKGARLQPTWSFWTKSCHFARCFCHFPCS